MTDNICELCYNRIIALSKVEDKIESLTALNKAENKRSNILEKILLRKDDSFKADNIKQESLITTSLSDENNNQYENIFNTNNNDMTVSPIIAVGQKKNVFQPSS